MKVLLFEKNLMWSAKLSQSLRALGYEPIVATGFTPGQADVKVAVINLGEAGDDASALVKELQAQGIRVIGHAGHKEQERLEFGKSLGVDLLATNSELTFKLPDLLGRLLTTTA